MRKFILWTGIIVGASLMSKPALANFEPAEFGIWYPLVNNDLLKMVDELRNRWGHPIYISPVTGGIGRADDSTSQHNVIHNLGSVNAIDVFPSYQGREIHPDDLTKFFNLAKEIGFTGIGIYRDTIYKNRPWTMFHLDVRSGGFAKWGRVAGNYVAVDEAIYL